MTSLDTQTLHPLQKMEVYEKFVLEYMRAESFEDLKKGLVLSQ